MDKLQNYVWKREPLPLKGIIDMHIHLGPWPVLFPGHDADSIVNEMDQVGVEKVFCTHEAAMNCNVVYGNNEVINAMKKYPDRFLGYAVTYAINDKLGIDEIKRCFDNGMHGIKLHTGDTIQYDDPRYKKIWKFADKNKLPVLLHTWGDMDKYETIFQEYPNTKVLLGHSGSCKPEYYVEFVKKYSNAYLDLTFSQAPYYLVEYFVKEAGADRVVFGSDIPWMSIAQQIGKVIFADITEEEKKTILVDNPKKILKR